MTLLLNFLVVASLLGSICYALFLGFMSRYWSMGKKKYQSIRNEKQWDNYPFVSIIIPARNEAANITACLRSILAQNYPKDRMEVIIVDDHSEDQTAEQVKTLVGQNVQLLSLANDKRGKKAALSAGIGVASGEIIITTDADCTMHENWLRSILCLFLAGNDMVLGPVRIISKQRTFLEAWQGLDVCGTLLMTGAAVSMGHPILANGANFAFRKKLYSDLGGFTGNEHRASGDDIFLLQKAVQNANTKIAFTYHQEATVATQATESWTSLFWQRLRWASKTSGYTDYYLLVFQAGVYLLNVALLIGMLLILIQPTLIIAFSLAWLLKATAEYFYLRLASRELGDLGWLNWFLPSLFVHTVYVVIIGTLALLPLSGKWKGRRIS